jgi:hypothetical protein
MIADGGLSAKVFAPSCSQYIAWLGLKSLEALYAHVPCLVYLRLGVLAISLRLQNMERRQCLLLYNIVTQDHLELYGIESRNGDPISLSCPFLDMALCREGHILDF